MVEQQRAIQEIPTLEELLDNAIVGDEATVCALNDNGLYGEDAVGGAAEQQQVKVVSYLYQISVVPGTSASLLDGTILEELDAAIPTAILPLLFPNDCAFSGGGRRHLQDNNNGGGTMLAVSQMPDDELVMDGCKY